LAIKKVEGELQLLILIIMELLITWPNAAREVTRKDAITIKR